MIRPPDRPACASPWGVAALCLCDAATESAAPVRHAERDGMGWDGGGGRGAEAEERALHGIEGQAKGAGKWTRDAAAAAAERALHGMPAPLGAARPACPEYRMPCACTLQGRGRDALRARRRRARPVAVLSPAILHAAFARALPFRSRVGRKKVLILAVVVRL